MLRSNKSITLTGYSVINENGVEVQVAYMAATISTDGSQNQNTSKSILNQEVYSKHRVEVREDINAFEDEVFKIEDTIMGAIE